MKRVWHFFWQSIKKYVTLSYFVFIFLDVYNTWIDLITYNFYSANFKLLRLESPSGMCAKLRTVAASNNRDHATRSLYYCLFAPHICWCCSSRTFRSWRTAHSVQRQRRCCNKIMNYLGYILHRFAVVAFTEIGRIQLGYETVDAFSLKSKCIDAFSL